MTNIQINGPGGVKLKMGVPKVGSSQAQPNYFIFFLCPTETRAWLSSNLYLQFQCFFDKTQNMKLVEHQTTISTI